MSPIGDPSASHRIAFDVSTGDGEVIAAETGEAATTDIMSPLAIRSFPVMTARDLVIFIPWF
jgi:hypothetical protein